MNEVTYMTNSDFNQAEPQDDECEQLDCINALVDALGNVCLLARLSGLSREDIADVLLSMSKAERLDIPSV
jgi:hypothetical protein